MELIEFSNNKYPKFQSLGNASQFAIPYALHFCKGIGFDIGFGKEEWKLPNAIGIDKALNNQYDANHLPCSENEIDYIYSSHCLEHVDNWIETLEYWISKIKFGGILFLYLPDFSQKYWRPWNNKKHNHCFTKEIVIEFLKDHNMKNIFSSGIDLNNSFMVVCEK
jgi:predicted SAM-dependent methyltransferase